MTHRAITALARTLQSRVSLGKSRLETMCLLIVGMVSARTVNLGHIACERPGSVLIASTYRRLQRFFQHAALPQDSAVPILADLIGSRGPWTLALDRTQWAIGARDLVSGAAVMLAPSGVALRTALAVRVACHARDAIGHGLPVPASSRAKVIALAPSRRLISAPAFPETRRRS